MKHRNICIGIIFVIVCTTTIFAQKGWRNNALFRLNSPDWVQTGGPGGGYVNDIAIDPSNPSILYAAGSGDGIYKSTDAGDKWILHQFTDAGGAQIIEIDPQNPATLYCDFQNFSKSIDAGLTWQQSTVGFGNDVQVHAFKLDPTNNSVLYMAGVGHHPHQAVVYKTEDDAQSWQNIMRCFF